MAARTSISLPLLALCSAAGLVLGCTASDANDCADGADNDGDGLVDSQDPGCALNGDLEFPDPVLAACSDRADNDSDGLIDLDDPGCDAADDDDETNAEVPACRDGIDNDGDGLIDFPHDPGCAVSLQDSEADDCPDGAGCPVCANGMDDDGDGTADYPDDLGCNGAADDDERSAPPPVCLGGLQSIDVGTPILDGFADDTGNSLISLGCGGTGPERGYTLSLAAPSALKITTNFAETNVDTVVYLQAMCGEMETELGCNDDIDTQGKSELFLPRVEAGDYVLVVDSHPGTTGDFKVEVTAAIPEGETCNPAAPDCAANLECQAATNTCETPITGPTCDDDGVIRAKVIPSAGDLLISEYMANPDAVGDALGEWFEVKVKANVDIGGLQLGRAEPATGPGAVLLTISPQRCIPVTAGTHLLFAREADTTKNGGLSAVDHLVGFGIVNTTDGLFIGMDDAILDTVTYSSTSQGASTSLAPDESASCTATTPYGDGDLGTPGLANQNCP